MFWGCLRGGENPLFTLKGRWVVIDKKLGLGEKIKQGGVEIASLRSQ
jgi:hypothetical protein